MESALNSSSRRRAAGFCILTTFVAIALTPMASATTHAFIGDGIPVPLSERQFLVRVERSGYQAFQQTASCSGALIDNAWVITSGDCVSSGRNTLRGQDITVITGESAYGTGGVRRSVDRVACLATERGAGCGADVALLRLETPIASEEGPVPIGIDDGSRITDYSDGTSLGLMGWGADVDGTFGPARLLRFVPPAIFLFGDPGFSLTLSDGRGARAGDVGGLVLWPEPSEPTGWLLSGIVRGARVFDSGRRTEGWMIRDASRWIEQELEDSRPSLQLSLAAPRYAKREATVPLTVSLTNHGPGRHEGGQISVELPSNGEYVGDDGRATLDGDRLLWDSPPLAYSESVTLTIRILLANSKITLPEPQSVRFELRHEERCRARLRAGRD